MPGYKKKQAQARWTKKKPALLWLVCIGFLCTAALASPAPPRESTEMNWTRRPVLFSHSTHLNALDRGTAPEQTCALCHHPVKGEVLFLTCTSPDCHDNLNQKDLSVHSYYQATHKKTKDSFYSCLSCHEERAGDDLARIKRLAGCKESACHP